MDREERKKMFDSETKNVKKKKEEKERNKGNFTPRTYEQIEYVALDQNVDVVVRFLGEVLSYRKDPTSMKQVLHTNKALDDFGRYSKITWSDDRNWFLWEVYNLVMHYKWKEDHREYDNKSKFPEIFNRMWKNNQVDNAMENGFKPDNFIVANVIDRIGYDWQVQNKHTKVLTKKVSMSNDIQFAEIGIPMSLYEMFITDIVEYQGDFEDYDVIIRKLADKPWYTVRHPLIHAMQMGKDNPELLKLCSTQPLTDEERSWTKYDFDKLYKVTSYNKLMNRFGKYIKEIDVAFKKNFYEKLEKLCEKEKLENKNNQNDNEQDQDQDQGQESNVKSDDKKREETKKVEVKTTTTTTTNNVAVEEEKKPPVTRKTRESVVKEEVKVQIDWKEFEEMGLEGISLLSDSEKSIVKGMNDQGEFDYDFDSSKIYECQVCHFPAPETFNHCPKCARKFS